MPCIMQVQFWGVRGSIPSPGPATVRYGGNTSCVSLRLANDTVLERVFKLQNGWIIATPLYKTFPAEEDGGVTMERNDPSDLTEGQWRKSRGLWPPKRGCKPRERRWVLNAILSVVRTGCPRRALPQDFPKWQPVATMFWRGRHPGVWKRVHDALRVRVRKQGGRSRRQRRRLSRVGA
jgi:transposase